MSSVYNLADMYRDPEFDRFVRSLSENYKVVDVDRLRSFTMEEISHLRTGYIDRCLCRAFDSIMDKTPEGGYDFQDTMRMIRAGNKSIDQVLPIHMEIPEKFNRRAFRDIGRLFDRESGLNIYEGVFEEFIDAVKKELFNVLQQDDFEVCDKYRRRGVALKAAETRRIKEKA